MSMYIEVESHARGFVRAVRVAAVAALFAFTGAQALQAQEQVVNFADYYAAPDLVSWNAVKHAKAAQLDMRVTAFAGGGNDMLASLAAGSSDASDLALSYIMRAMDAGIKLKILMGTGHKGTVIVAREGINSVAELKDKTIGGTPGSPPFMSGIFALKEAGLDPAKDVSIVNIGFPAQGQALASGQVDAIMTIPEVVAGAMKAGNFKVIYTPSANDPVGQNNSALVVRADFAEQHPDLVQKLVDAHYASLQELATMQKDNQEGLIDLATELLSGGGVQRETMAVAIPLTTYRASLNKRLLEEYAGTLHTYSITKQDVSGLWGDYLDFSYLAKSSGQPATSFEQ